MSAEQKPPREVLILVGADGRASCWSINPEGHTYPDGARVYRYVLAEAPAEKPVCEVCGKPGTVNITPIERDSDHESWLCAQDYKARLKLWAKYIEPRAKKRTTKKRGKQ